MVVLAGRLVSALSIDRCSGRSSYPRLAGASAVAACSFALAACGGAPTGTGGVPASPSHVPEVALFTRCLRAHGLEVQEPDASGAIPGAPALKREIESTSEGQRALDACEAVKPPGLG